MLWKKDQQQILVSEIKLSREYQFMYENFVVSSQRRLLLLLEKEQDIIHCLSFDFKIYKYGYPNDEVGHPMMKYGLGFYGLFKVENSPWIEELLAANSGHPHHSDSNYNKYKHYIAKFKDVTLEVVADDAKEIQLPASEIMAFVNKEMACLENE